MQSAHAAPLELLNEIWYNTQENKVYFHNNAEQVKAFLRDTVAFGGKGFYLRDVYYAYTVWCTENDAVALGKLTFASFLEAEGFERRSLLKNKIRYTRGTLRETAARAPQETRGQRARRVHEQKELRARRRVAYLEKYSTPEATAKRLARREARRRRLLEKQILEEAQERGLDGKNSS